MCQQRELANVKIVYISPTKVRSLSSTKALCSEKTRDWTASFKSLGITCAELTGDSDFTQQQDIRKANIIVTTPEKWDSITRKWSDSKELFKMLRLFLVSGS